MSKECGPSGEEGSGDGLVKGFWALAGSGFGELAGEPCCFFAPTVSCFNSRNDQAVATWLDKFWARPFVGPSCCACVLSSALSGCSLAGEEENDGDVKLPIHHWIQKIFTFATCGAKGGLGGQNTVGTANWGCIVNQKIGRSENIAQNLEVLKQQLNGVLDFCSLWACNVCIK